MDVEQPAVEGAVLDVLNACLLPHLLADLAGGPLKEVSLRALMWPCSQPCLTSHCGTALPLRVKVDLGWDSGSPGSIC